MTQEGGYLIIDNTPGRNGCAVRGSQLCVACQLARNGGLVAADDGGHLGLAMGSFLQVVNLVSLLAGKLRVAHQCASLTWRFEKARYVTAACLSIANLKVALTS